MRLNFRQGITRSRAVLGVPDFLTYNNVFSTIDVNITTPWLIVTAAFKDKNYLLEERANQAQSWGPFLWNATMWGTAPTVITYQLFWDVNLATGAVTKGYTPWTPVYGPTPPTNQRIDQHWFSTLDNIMYVWDSTAWQQKCRVFAASFGPSTQVITPRPFYSQVGISGVDVLAGYIAYGEDLKGIRLDDGTFLTSSTDLVVNTGRYSSPITLEAASAALVAAEPIPAFTCVTNFDLSEAKLANPFNIEFYPIGVTTKEAALGESVEYLFEGVIYNDQWNWDFSLGKDIFCGVNGTLYQGDPVLADQGALKIGTILSAVSIQVHIDRFGLGGGGMGPLDHDVLVIGTNVGAVDAGYTFPTGMTFSEFVEVVSKRTLPPAYTGPTLTLSSNPTPTNFEIGTIISPILTRTLALHDAGPENGMTLSKNSILLSTAIPYTDVNVTLGSTPIVYSSTSSYDEGACKLNNRGVIDCNGHIAAGTITSNSITFNGTRMAFWGFPSSVPATSADVRSLGNSSFNSTDNTTVDSAGVATGNFTTANFTITIPIGAVKVVIAYPATSRSVASIKYQELSDSEVKYNFVETTASVEGANGFAAVTYRVFTYTPVEPFSQSVHYRVFI
jgi:hypothetical protein